MEIKKAVALKILVSCKTCYTQGKKYHYANSNLIIIPNILLELQYHMPKRNIKEDQELNCLSVNTLK